MALNRGVLVFGHHLLFAGRRTANVQAAALARLTVLREEMDSALAALSKQKPKKRQRKG